jgi:hypothetical protein
MYCTEVLHCIITLLKWVHFVLTDVAHLGNLDPSLYRQHDTDDDYEMPDHHIGRIWFRVQYERETEKLLVTLVKAKNLPSKSLTTNNVCDPFVRWVCYIISCILCGNHSFDRPLSNQTHNICVCSNSFNFTMCTFCWIFTSWFLEVQY